jgi:hypothetical protein
VLYPPLSFFLRYHTMKKERVGGRVLKKIILPIFDNLDRCMSLKRSHALLPWL